MLILIDKKATKEDIQKASEDLDGYVKFVVDIEREILTIGGARHFDGEQMLLKEGSSQSNLWGGGYDLEGELLDYESMINIRPNDNNPSREILSLEIRSKVDNILKEKLGWQI